MEEQHPGVRIVTTPWDDLSADTLLEVIESGKPMETTSMTTTRTNTSIIITTTTMMTTTMMTMTTRTACAVLRQSP